MAGLLAAEDAALAPQRLEDVAVADVGRHDADAALLHQPMEAEVRHRRHRHEVDAERERADRDDLVAVDDLTALVDGEHPVTVAVERDAEIEVARRARPPGGARGRWHRSPSLMFVPSGELRRAP